MTRHDRRGVNHGPSRACRVLCSVVVLGASAGGVLLGACAAPDGARTVEVAVVIGSSRFEPQVVLFEEQMAAFAGVGGYHVDVRSATSTGAGVADEIDDLLAARPDVVVTWSTPSARLVAAGEGASDVPHVFTAVDDALASGLVDDLARPGGLRTGVESGQPTAKSLEWLVRAAGVRFVLAPHDPADPDASSAFAEASRAAEALGVRLVPVGLGDVEHAVQAAVGASGQRPGRDVPRVGLLLLPGVSVHGRVDEILRAAHRIGVPVGNASAALASVSGPLVSFVDDVVGRVHVTAELVDRIIDGERPGDLRVRSAPLSLVVDVAVADALGVDPPIELFELADEIRR